MEISGVYRIGEFTFTPETGRLQWPDDPKGTLLPPKEASLLTALMRYVDVAARNETYRWKLIEAVWPGNTRADESNLHTLIHKLRERFGNEGYKYILSDPYQLGIEPVQVEVPPSQASREGIGGGFAVAAEMRFGRCLMCQSLANSGQPNKFTVPVRDNASENLAWYLYPLRDRWRESKDRVAIMAGIDDRYDPIGPTKFSESGGWVTSHYIDAFRTSPIEPVNELAKLHDDDALVLIGSNEVNPKLREYLGEPSKHAAVHRIRFKPEQSLGYEVEGLPWAIFTPEDARDVHMFQTREQKPAMLRKTKEHVVSCLEGSPLRATAGRLGDHDIWLTDYLLITALPTDATEERRMISFAGLHRTGTLAAGKLVSEPPPSILDTIHRTLGGHPYFQALLPLSVDNAHSETGRAQPGSFIESEVKVELLKIRKNTFKS